MAKCIIGIHGLANKPKRETLKTWWHDSIDEGLAKNNGIANATYRFEMVYWANLLYRYPLHDDNDLDFDKLYNREPYYPARKSNLKRYNDRWIDRARADLTEIGGRGLDALKETLGVGGVADALLGRVLQDLAYYWDRDRLIRDRNRKRRVVAKVLDDECRTPLIKHRDDEIMLIAHSMGTIISYNVLRDLGQTDLGVEVPYFITIGSPLGLSHVKAKTESLRDRARTPTIVTERWVNFSDRRDPVALDTHLRDDYSANSLGVRVFDDLVLNDYEMDKPNPHKSYGYLRTPEMSDIIAEFLAR